MCFIGANVRVLKTRRPITPYSSNSRHLFGNVDIIERPVSSISNISVNKKNISSLPHVQNQYKKVPRKSHNEETGKKIK